MEGKMHIPEYSGSGISYYSYHSRNKGESSKSGSYQSRYFQRSDYRHCRAFCMGLRNSLDIGQAEPVSILNDTGHHQFRTMRFVECNT